MLYTLHFLSRSTVSRRFTQWRWRLFVFCEKKLYKARLFVKFCQGFFYTRICPSLIMVFFYAFKTIFLKCFAKKNLGKWMFLCCLFWKWSANLWNGVLNHFSHKTKSYLKKFKNFVTLLEWPLKLWGNFHQDLLNESYMCMTEDLFFPLL